MTPSLEGWPTKAKEAPSPHEVRPALLDTNRVFQRLKRLYPTESVKYLGVKIDTNLTWQHHVDDLSIKLNRGNTLFSNFKVSGEKLMIQFCSVCEALWMQIFISRDPIEKHNQQKDFLKL